MISLRYQIILKYANCRGILYLSYDNREWRELPKRNSLRRRRYVDDWIRESSRRFLEEILEEIQEDFCPAKKSQKKRPPEPISDLRRTHISSDVSQQ